MTIEQRVEHLEFEIERLNRTNRRWRRIACTMAVLVVAGIGIGAAQMNEDELTLRRLVIQDEKGRKRIMLDADKHGGRYAAIRHYDADGEVRIISGTFPDGPAGIQHYDANGESRIWSVTYPNGAAGIQHSDTNGKKRIVSGTGSDGNASISHFDANEELRIVSRTSQGDEAFTSWWEYDTNGKIQPVKKIP